MCVGEFIHSPLLKKKSLLSSLTHKQRARVEWRFREEISGTKEKEWYRYHASVVWIGQTEGKVQGWFHYAWWGVWCFGCEVSYVPTPLSLSIRYGMQAICVFLSGHKNWRIAEQFHFCNKSCLRFFRKKNRNKAYFWVFWPVPHDYKRKNGPFFMILAPP